MWVSSEARLSFIRTWILLFINDLCNSCPTKRAVGVRRELEGWLERVRAARFAFDGVHRQRALQFHRAMCSGQCQEGPRP